MLPVLPATSAGWQVTLCEPMWHVSSSSGVATSVSELLYPCYFRDLLVNTNEPSVSGGDAASSKILSLITCY